MVKQIQEGKAEFIRRQSNSRTVWRFWINGRPVRAVYSSTGHRIVTVLTSRYETKLLKQENGDGF